MNRLFYLLYAALIMLIALPIFAVNHLDIMTYMSGEFSGSEFGESIASLDFNADGYRDLVVSSGAWNPSLTFMDQNRWGKLYFFWGGPDFNNVPDFVVPGTYNWQIGPYASVFNAGDINGDGIEDIIMLQTSQYNEDLVAVYYGGQNPQTTPSLILTYPNPEVSWLKIVPIGDLNGDNRDDVAIIARHYPTTTIVTIWVDFLAQPIFLYQTNNTWTPFLSGIGDVNDDGYDDCLLHLPIFETGQDHNKLILYYGNPNFPEADSLVICEDSNSIIKKWSCPLGDVNGDGYDDFTSGSLVYDSYQHLWLGSDTLSPVWSMDLSAYEPPPPSDISERGSGYPFVHGDMNGDGYQDVLGFDSEEGYYSGYLYLWMGSTSMNGSLDYVQLGISGYDSRNFGWSKATGDFNADGYCDVAVGAPWFGYNDHIDTGRVYILAGNADLHETTVANEDDIITSLGSNLWQFEAYPNPLAHSESLLNIKFEGSAYQTASNLELDVYNIKGQKLLSQPIPPEKLQEQYWKISTDSWSKGVLILSVSQGGKKLMTKKITNY